MKKLLFLLSLILSLTSSAQKSTLDSLVQKHFPDMDTESYLTHKITAIYHDQYGISPPEELKPMIGSSDEVDTDLQEAIALYVSNPENFSKLVKSTQTYSEKFPDSKLLTENDITLALRSFLSECLPVESVYQIETIRMREE